MIPLEETKPKPRIEIVPLADECFPLASVLDGVEMPPGSAVWLAFDHSKEGIDKVAGRVALVPFLMIEATHIKEEYRGTSLAVRLVRTVENHVAQSGHTHLMSLAYSDEVADYLRRFGYEELPLKVFVKQVAETDSGKEN